MAFVSRFKFSSWSFARPRRFCSTTSPREKVKCVWSLARISWVAMLSVMSVPFFDAWSSGRGLVNTMLWGLRIGDLVLSGHKWNCRLLWCRTGWHVDFRLWFAILLVAIVPSLASAQTCSPSRFVMLTPYQQWAYQVTVEKEYKRQLLVYAADAPKENLQRELKSTDSRIRWAASAELDRRLRFVRALPKTPVLSQQRIMSK